MWRVLYCRHNAKWRKRQWVHFPVGRFLWISMFKANPLEFEKSNLYNLFEIDPGSLSNSWFFSEKASKFDFRHLRQHFVESVIHVHWFHNLMAYIRIKASKILLHASLWEKCQISELFTQSVPLGNWASRASGTCSEDSKVVRGVVNTFSRVSQIIFLSFSDTIWFF